MIATEIDIEHVMNRLRDIADEKDEISGREKALNEERAELEKQAIQYHEKTGLKQIANARLSISFDPDAMRAKYDPEKWQEIVKWAVATGNDHIIQRRLTDTRVIDLIDNGIALPDGLNVEQYTKISIRRKN